MPVDITSEIASEVAALRDGNIEIALVNGLRITLNGDFDPGRVGHLFVFRGRRGDLIKIIWWSGEEHSQGACLFSKRLEAGRFVWPSAKDGKISLSPAQLSMLLEGIDWRMPRRTWRPSMAG